MTSILLVGHISEDIRDGKIFDGGPPRYQIPICRHFNMDITVLTSCMEENSFLKEKGIEILRIPSETNTVFSFKKTSINDDRMLVLKDKASNLEDFEELLSNSYDLSIISPIANEISKESMRQIIDISGVTFLDVQGLARSFGSNGEVSGKLSLEDLEWSLMNFDYVKTSKSELGDYDWINPYSSKLIITNSGKDIEIQSTNKSEFIKIVNEENIVDDTGSGDIFLASLAAKINETSLIDSIKFAECVARAALQIQGVPTILELKESLE